MLALEPGRTVSADRLAEGLWGDELPPSAAKMVQLYVSHLRRVLDGDGVRIVTHGRGYELQLPERRRRRRALRAAGGRVAPARRARAVARRRARRPRRRAVRGGRDPPARGAARARGRVRDRRRPRGGPPRRGGRRARRARRRASAARAPARPADARALPLRPPVRGARGLPRRARRARRARSGSSRAPSCSACTTRSSRRTPRSTCRAAAEPDAAPRAAAAHAAHAAGRRRRRAARRRPGVRAHPRARRRGPAGHRRGRRRADRSGERSHHRAEYAVGKSPSAVVAGGGSVWVANAADGTVTRIDRERDERVDDPGRRRARRRSRSAAARCGWPTATGATVAQVDPGSNKVVQRVRGRQRAARRWPRRRGALWVASGVDGRVRRDRPRRAAASPARSAVGANPTAIAAGAGALWVASEEAGTVTRDRRRAPAPRSPIRGRQRAERARGGRGRGVGRQPPRRHALADRPGHERGVVDRSASAATRPRSRPARARCGWRAGRRASSPRRAGRTARGRADRSTGAARRRSRSPADRCGRRRTPRRPRIAAGRCACSCRTRPAALVPMDWLHPAAYTTWATSQLELAGLRRPRRATGASRARPARRSSARSPRARRHRAADGRTYVFTLRRGVALLRRQPGAAHRRARVDGALPAGHARAPAADHSRRSSPASRAPRRACAGRRGASSARGIEVDERSADGHHPSHPPDADFLHKLATSFAFVVPADSARRPRRAARRPAPARTASPRWDSQARRDARPQPLLPVDPARRAGRLRGPDRGPASYPEPTIERADRGRPARRRGRDGPRRPVQQPRSREPHPRARGQLAGPVHSAPQPTSEWMFLNVRRRPFDDPRVRQRDQPRDRPRDRVVELAGGSEVG